MNDSDGYTDNKQQSSVSPGTVNILVYSREFCLIVTAVNWQTKNSFLGGF